MRDLARKNQFKLTCERGVLGTHLPAFASWVVCLALLALTVLANSSPSAAESASPGTALDWGHLRGPSYDGTAVFSGSLDRSSLELEVAWKATLGSGYSGIAVGEGKVVVLFTDGIDDLAVAFDSGSGEEVWRYRIDEMNAGRNGSHDGPISSPTLHAGRVFVLGARGQLTALRLSSGALLWQRFLPDDLGAEVPDFGFGTTPIVVDDSLVVLAGGSQGRSLVAFDPATGAERWSVALGKVEYQSPVPMTIDGVTHVVAIAGNQILGVAPADGSILWTHDLGEDDWANSATPTPLGENRFFATISSQGVVFEVHRSAGQWRVEEVLSTSDLGAGYALPVYHEGYLYGFRGQILSCIDAKTGERKWRSRPPGGRGLVLVNDRLVVFGASGQVVVAEASPSAYVELARVEALDASAYTWPSYADGRVFVRNLEQLAAVDLVARIPEPLIGELAVVEPTPVLSGLEPESDAPQDASTEAFPSFVSRLRLSEEPDALIEDFLETTPHLPVVEGEQVHFVYVGPGEDMAISGSMLDVGQADSLFRIGRTPFFYRSYKLSGAERWEYRFVRDFGTTVLDPRNALVVPGERGEFSELRLRGFESPAHLESPAGPKGTMESLEFESQLQEGLTRSVKVYLPPGYRAATGGGYPLLIVHEGEDWLSKGLLTNTLDNLIGESLEPMVVAFVAQREEWWLEAGGTETIRYVDSLARELVPFLESRYHLREQSESRAVYGRRHFGMTAFLAAFRHPDVFGKAAAQSVGLWLGSEGLLFELIASGRPSPSKLYLDWNRNDARSLDSGYDFSANSRELAAALSQGGFTFDGGEQADSYGWGGWRARSAAFLEHLFPLQ